MQRPVCKRGNFIMWRIKEAADPHLPTTLYASAITKNTLRHYKFISDTENAKSIL